MTLSAYTIRTAPAERRRVDAVLLDVDGTLIASNDAHARSWVDTLAEGGFSTRFEDVRPLIGMGGEQIVEELTGVAPDELRSRWLRGRRSEIFRERYLGELRPQPGARELVQKLRDRGFPLVVATSSPGSELHALLEIAGVADLVTTCTSADDVELAKPAPDVVRAALAKVGCAPEHAILIGDTPYDVRAGRAAHVATIALRCGGWDDEALDGAIEVFDDPKDLLRNWMQTPFRASMADLDAPL